MDLQDVELSEIPAFFNALGREKDLVMMNLESVMACDFIAGIRSNNELAGLTGIRIQYGFIPSLFIVVKEKYQGKGFASRLLGKNIAYARMKYSFLSLDTWQRPEYDTALHIYKKHGFMPVYNKGEHLWMCIPFNKKGKVIRNFLPLIYTVLPVISAVYSRLVRRK
jgi:GNAT superfamily N-acetyltransferase